MVTARTALTRRLAAALDATPSRIPVLVGATGTGRTTVVQQLRDRAPRGTVQYIDVERMATTPERFLRALVSTSPFPASETAAPNARKAFDAALAFFVGAHTGTGEPVTFILDEFLELRTFESFPGLRRVLYELLDGLTASPNRFVLTSRYTARTLRVMRDRSARFEVLHTPRLTAEETLDMLGGAAPGDAQNAEYLARTVQALADGRPSYVRAIAAELVAMREHGGPGAADPISALSALFGAEGRLAQLCHFAYELQLHRARGYGALKAILEILADQEGLTLTEISQRLQRTPGSTKDYLSWLEDVDLVASKQKRYSFADPLLRTWVRLYCRPSAPTEDDIAREVHRYALPRLPQASEPAAAPAAAPALALATAGGPPEDEKKAWGIIEID